MGAIANEANLNSRVIGRIDIFPNFSTVDLPEEIPSATITHLQSVRVAGRQLDIAPDRGGRSGGGGRPARHGQGGPKRRKAS